MTAATATPPRVAALAAAACARGTVGSKAPTGITSNRSVSAFRPVRKGSASPGSDRISIQALPALAATTQCCSMPTLAHPDLQSDRTWSSNGAPGGVVARRPGKVRRGASSLRRAARRLALRTRSEPLGPTSRTSRFFVSEIVTIPPSSDVGAPPIPRTRTRTLSPRSVRIAAGSRVRPGSIGQLDTDDSKTVPVHGSKCAWRGDQCTKRSPGEGSNRRSHPVVNTARIGVNAAAQSQIADHRDRRSRLATAVGSSTPSPQPTPLSSTSRTVG